MRLPVLAAPMFLASGPELVTAASTAGIIGSFPSLNCRTPDQLDHWLTQITSSLAGRPDAAPFAVNVTVHQTNDRARPDLDACARHQVPIVITSMGVNSEVVDQIHEYGGRIFHDVTTTRHARKAADAGVDGIVLVAAGAGGHAGTLNPFSFVREVREHFDGTLLLAGGMGTGRDIAAAEALGVDIVSMGTRFLATRESRADEAHKQLLVDSTTRDVRYTSAICSVPASFLDGSLRSHGIDPAALQEASTVDIELVTRPHDRTVLGREVRPWRDLWSGGQSVAAIKDIPSVADLVSRLDAEYSSAWEHARDSRGARSGHGEISA